MEKVPAWSTGDSQIDSLFSSDGGLVPSLILVSGDGGTGKSTLLRQLSDKLQKTGAAAIYFSSEENLYNIKQAAARLNLNFIVDEAKSVAEIIAKCTEYRKAHPGQRLFVTVDSLQSFSHGTPKRQMEDLSLLYDWKQDATVFVVSQVNKKGISTGTNGIGHKVDAHLMLQQDKLKRSPTYGSFFVHMVKNRDGQANVSREYEIGADGFKFVPENKLKAKLAKLNDLMGGTDRVVRKANQGIRIAKFLKNFF